MESVGDLWTCCSSRVRTVARLLSIVAACFCLVCKHDGVNNNTGELVASRLDGIASEADMIALVQRTSGHLRRAPDFLRW